MLLSLVSFSDKWVAAAVHKNVKASVLEDPVKALENARSLNEEAVIQLFDAKCVVSVKQIHAAAVAAHLAFKAGSNISKKFEIEFLLRLAADTQIERVLEKIGVNLETKEFGLCIMTRDKDSALKTYREIASLIGGDPMNEDELRKEERLKKAMNFYEIIDEEIDAVQAPSKADAVLLLILERIATLDLKR